MWFLSAMIQAKSVGDNLFHLVYNGEGPTDNFLYITSGSEGEQVTVEVSNYQSFHSKQRGYQENSLLKDYAYEKTGRARQEVIQLKSLINLKLVGTNVGFAE